MPSASLAGAAMLSEERDQHLSPRGPAARGAGQEEGGGRGTRLPILDTTDPQSFPHAHPVSSLVSVSVSLPGNGLEPEPTPCSVGLPQPRRQRRHILLDVESGKGRRLLNILTSHAAPTAPTPAQRHQAAKQSALRERLEQERAEQEERDRQEREERRREREEQAQARLGQERERLEALWRDYRSDLSPHRRTATQPALYWCPAGEEQ